MSFKIQATKWWNQPDDDERNDMVTKYREAFQARFDYSAVLSTHSITSAALYSPFVFDIKGWKDSRACKAMITSLLKVLLNNHNNENTTEIMFAISQQTHDGWIYDALDRSQTDFDSGTKGTLNNQTEKCVDVNEF